jgi:hypothetical protein
LPWARITSSKSCLHSCTLLHYACMLHMKRTFSSFTNCSFS